MPWQLQIASRARKALERLPARDQQRLVAALQSMHEDPFGGDIARLQARGSTWRRRVGNYRIFFDVDIESQRVDVTEIRRRTTVTY